MASFLRRQKSSAVVRRSPPPAGNDQAYAFRRSRTLTGSSSSQVVGAGEARAQLKSPRIKHHELRLRRRWLTAWLAGTLVAAAGCIWLLDQYIYKIDMISTTPPLLRKVDVKPYREAADYYFSSRPFERFRFALRRDQFASVLRSRLPEVSTVAVSGAKGLASTELTVALRRPVAVWQSDGNRVYVDQEGQTFKNNYYAEPSVVIEDQSGLSLDGKTQLVASSRLLRFAGKLVSGVDAAGIGSVQKVVIPLGALRQLDISLSGKPYRIKTQMDREPVGQVADIVSAVRYFDSHGVRPEYIDVRVEGKAFYR